MNHSIKSLFSGCFAVILTGLIALLLSQHYAAPAMLFALLLGIALSFLYQKPRFINGIDFMSTWVLRLGVALLGLRIVFNDLLALGFSTLLILISAVVSTLIFGIVLAKVLGLSKRFGALTGGSVAICGASAAMAISAVLPNSKTKEQDTLLTVIGVTSLSTVAMILYPILANTLNFTAVEASIFLGGTIHDVAQVVGAGYSMSTETGDLSTLVKLVRVSFLMPVVFMIMLAIKHAIPSQNPQQQAAKFPGFLMAFILLMVINSVIELPRLLIDTSTDISRLALICAITAIGMKSNLAQLANVGIKPIILMVAESFWLALFMISAILIF